MQSSKPIGIFDSGVGGLSVLGELKKLLPNENLIYFGDSANVPYGEKTSEELISFSRNILNYFKSQDVKMVLMACNTSSAVTLGVIKEEYDFPILGLIEPTAKFLKDKNISNIGIIATSATIKSNAYKNSILKYSPDKNIYQMACPGLVEIVEEEKIATKEAKELVKTYIEPLMAENVEKIVLGCTHYPFLGDLIIDLAKNDDILINPAEYLAKEALELLKNAELLNRQKGGKIDFYTSKNPEEFVSVGKKLYTDLHEADLLEINLKVV
ncbi:MAG: glutamate racemase [bacterium]